MLVIIGFSIIGVVVICVNVVFLVNMNNLSDVMCLLFYFNCEQYGECFLFCGFDFDVDFNICIIEVIDCYGLVGDCYEIIDYKVLVDYFNCFKCLFLCMGDNIFGCLCLYKQWLGMNFDQGMFLG